MQIQITSVHDVHKLSFLGKMTFDQSFGYLFRDRNGLINYLENTFSEEKLRKILKYVLDRF
ncbi:hypothetical protein ACWGOQ_0018165 [Aquimarina sp. M1]